MKMVRKLMCVNITSKDSKRLADFTVLSVFPFMSTMKIMTVGFWEIPKTKAALRFGMRTNGGRLVGFITMVFEVDDLEETYEKIISQGIAINPPRTADWGGQEVTLKDPDGNIIMFL